MKILYMFWLLCSVLVLAADEEEAPPPPPPPPETTTATTTKEASVLNNLQCPACSNLTSDFCEEKTAPCKGSETFCLHSTGSIVLEDNSASTFVVKGCATELILMTLLGVETVEPGKYTINQLIFEMAREAPTEKPTEASTEEPTEGPTEKRPTEKPNDKVTETITKRSGSPSISPDLFFALWLPSITYLLLMNLLS